MCPHTPLHDAPSACMLHIHARICRNQGTHIYPCSTRCRSALVSLASLHIDGTTDPLARDKPGWRNARAHWASKWSGSRQRLHVLFAPTRRDITVEACRLVFNSFNGCRTAKAACCWRNHFVFEPAWCPSDDEACICQHVQSLCILCLDCNVGQETRYLCQ